MKSSRLPALPAAAGVYRLHAAGVVDPCARAQPGGPTDLLVELGEAGAGRTGPGWSLARPIRVLACGRPADIDSHPGAACAVEIDLGRSVLLPGMVNAHAHLDLTHLGPHAHDPAEGFVAWVDRIRAGRAEEAGAIRASVGRGVELSLRAGVVAVGDIAGAPRGVPRIEPFEALGETALRGVSFVEFFAMGRAEAPALERLGAFLANACGRGANAAPGPIPRPVRLGLQPHAPNTVSLPAYRRAIELARRFGLPLATHLAETPEEREFISRGTGPQREMLERFGIWDDAILEHLGRGRTPVEHLAGVLASEPFVVAHLHDAGPGPAGAFQTLVGARATVVYCPRAGEYFQAARSFGPHRYREMLAAGVNVCLGTDSVVNLPPGVDGPDGPGLSVLDEARLLFRRDGADAGMLVRMMTVNGCRALGLGEAICSLGEGAEPGGLVAVAAGEGDGPPAERVLGSDAPAALLAISPVSSAS
ncbi:MAG: amidohydrolase family protein [Phycisphaerales bacterium]|nr:amidohydrolase family protein [Phycisphaerales bacterium]